MPPLQPLTRHDALASWSEFLPTLASYAGARNRVQTGHGNVSRLGASIRFRTLTEDEIIQTTLERHTFRVAEKWLQEVCWRRYWKGWLEMRPQVWSQWRRRIRSLQQTLPAETLARAEAVTAARSGVACMDRIARELVDTGYLHNHARMWWASFWIHAEQLPWELGADFFFRHLLDADPASNTLSWRWVAGLQTAGKAYLVRLSNIEKYAPDYLAADVSGADRIADGVVTAHVPEDFCDVTKLTPPQYPTSFHQNTERTGLWLHPDDLAPESGPLSSLAPAAIAGCISDRVYRGVYRLSSQRIDSLHTVIRDGLARAAAHYAAPAVVVDSEDPVQGLGAWAGDHALSEVVAFAPMVGPIHEMVPRLRQHLASIGTRLTLIRRPSDQTALDFSTAGFFPFWQKMSRHLSTPSQQ